MDPLAYRTTECQDGPRPLTAGAAPCGTLCGTLTTASMGVPLFKKIAAALAVAFAFSLASAVPASASVPDWDAKTVASLQAQGLVVKTPAEWESIKTVLNRPQDKAFFAGSPVAPSALMKKNAYDCPENTNTNGIETMCLWNGYSFTGTIWKLPISWLNTGQSPDQNGLSFYGSGINNTSKAWWNRSYQPVTLYDRDDCQTPSGSWYRHLGANYEAFSTNPGTNDWENRIGSVSTQAVEGEYCTNNPSQ